MTAALDPETLETWLAWAGVRLIAMPGGRVGPADYRVFWPDYSQDRFQILEKRGVRPLRVASPSGPEISLVDEILLLPNLCDKVIVRRILHVRCLCHPVNLRHLYSWTRVATLLDIKISSAKYMHKVGLREVCTKADPEKVCTIERRLNAALADLPVL